MPYTINAITGRFDFYADAASLGAVTEVNVDSSTAPGTDPVVPDGTGQISILGNTVANATNLSPVATHSRAANQFQIDVQVATAIASAPVDVFDAGLASFDSNQFDVDSNGFVQIKGGGFIWNAVPGTSQGLVSGNGYIPQNIALTTFTLPAVSAVGDTFQIAGYGTGLYTIAQNAGQQIHFGTSSTTIGVGGSLTATNRRDCLEILCVVANTEFMVIDSIGTFTVV